MSRQVEDAIRSYLSSVGRPAKPLVDREAVASLKARIREEEDPIEKLRLLSALEEEEAGRLPDTSGDRAVFVAEARAWAEQEQISVSAFQALGVPDDDLREAGFEVPTGSPARRAVARSTAAGGARAARIPIADVKKVVRQLGSGWRLADLAAALDREPATVRNYVNKLVDDGFVTVIGDDPRHDGRGRAPKLYAVSSVA